MTTTKKRTTLALELRPIAGSRFQPTGFPDLGAATFERAGEPGERLLVESVQSMANHLEAMTWNPATNAPADAVAALPYVRVVDGDGGFLTSSRLEAHRLASAYVLGSKLAGRSVLEVLKERLGLVKGKPLDMHAAARAIFALDPVSLVHGVFFAQSSWPWQPKIARAMTVFIEASDVRAAVSGGVKRDSVFNEADKSTGRSSAEGYGMVPHHRVEYTAGSITLYAVIDEQQFASYGLSPAATELLSALAGWELAGLLDGGLRLRTACDLVIADASANEVPSFDDAAGRLSAAVDAVRPELAESIDVVWTAPTSKAKPGSALEES